MSPIITRADVIRKAREYLKVPFVHQGRSRHGLDCAGLCVVVGLDLGLLTKEDNFFEYGRVPNPRVMRDVLNKRGKRTRWVEAQPGDVILMGSVGYNMPCHLAILLDGDKQKHRIIHSFFDAGGVVETEMSQDWINKVICAFSFPGLVVT